MFENESGVERCTADWCCVCCSGGAGVLARPQEVRCGVRQHHGYPAVTLLHEPDQRGRLLLSARTHRHHLLPYLQEHPAGRTEDQRRPPVQVSNSLFLVCGT